MEVQIRRVYRFLPVFILYTDKIPPKRFAGITNLNIIRIQPKYKQDKGLLEHELTHVKQFYRSFGLSNLKRSLRAFKTNKLLSKLPLANKLVKIGDREAYYQEIEAYTTQILTYLKNQFSFDTENVEQSNFIRSLETVQFDARYFLIEFREQINTICKQYRKNKNKYELLNELIKSYSQGNTKQLLNLINNMSVHYRNNKQIVRFLDELMYYVNYFSKRIAKYYRLDNRIYPVERVYFELLANVLLNVHQVYA